MEKRVGYIALCDMIFILLVSLSGSFPAGFSRVVYYLAYVLPILAMLIVFRADMKPLFSLPKRQTLEISALSLAPFLGVIILISALISYLLGMFGASNETDVSGHILYEITRHALVPAVLEELLFRFIPISLIMPYSKKNAVFISSMLFAFAHCSLFQIPYALAAGLVLGTLTVMTGSIIPAAVFHFINNALSVVMMKYGTPDIMMGFYITLGALSVLSCLGIAFQRKKYVPMLRAALPRNEKISLPPGALIFVLMTSLIAVINLASQFLSK